MTRLPRGPREELFLHQRRRHALCGGGLARQGLLHRLLRPDARAWFGRQYKVLTDLGIEGFWNDMNEPALFYSPERLKAFFENAAALSRKDNLDQNDFFGWCAR